MNARLRGFQALAAALSLLLTASARCSAELEPSIRQISYGHRHFCAVTTAAELMCWGENDLGQIGNGKFSRSLPDARVTDPTLIIPQGVTAVSAGSGHTCAIVNGALYCWGANTSGEIGNGKTDADAYKIGTTLPAMIIPANVKAVSAGGMHTCAIVGEDLQCWGGNYSGQIGTDSLKGNTSKPVTIIKGGVSAVSAGSAHTCAVVRGDLWCWGSNTDGQIGNGSMGNNAFAPVKVISGRVSAVTAARYNTCAIVDGALQCWGKNVNNAFVPDATANVLTPRTIISGGVRAIAMSDARYCAVVRGALQCWGYNSNNELGTGSGKNELIKTPREVIPAGVSAVGLGERGTCALVNGALRFRGWDAYLTDEITPSQSAPFSVAKWDIPLVSHAKSDKRIAQTKSPAAITEYLASHRLIYQNGVVYYMSQATADLYPHSRFPKEPTLLLRIEAIPLFRSTTVAGPSSGVGGNLITIAPGAKCGLDDGRAQTLESTRFYIQTDERFTNLRDALQTSVPVLPAFESNDNALNVSAADMRKIRDCAMQVATTVKSLPYRSITYSLHSGQDVSIPASLLSKWQNTDRGWVKQISVLSKPGKSNGFSVQAYTVSAMQCGQKVLRKWKRWESPVLNLGAGSTSFGINSALLLANSRDFPAYTEIDLRRAIRAEEGGPGLAGEAEARVCLAAVIGERFEIRFGDAIVHQFSIELPAPQPALSPDCNRALSCKTLPDANGKRIALIVLDANGTRRFGEAPPVTRKRNQDAPNPQDTFGMPGDTGITENADQVRQLDAQASPLQQESYDLGLFIVDERSGEIYNRYLEKRAYVSAPLALKRFAVDTGRYSLAPDTRAFGLRAEYSDPSTLAPQGETTLKLFVRNGNTLDLVLDGLVMNKISAQWSGACVGTSTELKRVIDIGTTTHNGYADLIVTTTVNRTQRTMDGGKCVGKRLPPSAVTVPLHYDGKRYVVPVDLRAAR